MITFAYKIRGENYEHSLIKECVSFATFDFQLFFGKCTLCNFINFLFMFEGNAKINEFLKMRFSGVKLSYFAINCKLSKLFRVPKNIAKN